MLTSTSKSSGRASFWLALLAVLTLLLTIPAGAVMADPPPPDGRYPPGGSSSSGGSGGGGGPTEVNTDSQCGPVGCHSCRVTEGVSECGWTDPAPGGSGGGGGSSDGGSTGTGGGGGGTDGDDSSADGGGTGGGGAPAPPPPPIPADEAALILSAGFNPAPVEIGMAPEDNPEWGHRRSYVGLPIWMWVQNPSASSWGPQTWSGSTGGQTIDFTARATSVSWNMGDGSTVACGQGTPYSTAYGNVASPTCGHRYTHVSKFQPDGMYTVTATTYWTIAWTSATTGESGTLTASAASSTQVEILQLQSVNT